MEWISVKDERPNDNQEILMTYNNLVMEGKFVNGKFYLASLCAHVQGYCDCHEQEGISHWQPMPSPPSN